MLNTDLAANIELLLTEINRYKQGIHPHLCFIYDG
jgi:hypothetical protein